MNHIAVVGASLAGLHVVQHLRRLGFTGRLTLVGEELHLPYDRPPLSKKILLGLATLDDIALRAQPWDALDLDLRLGVRAVGLDASTKSLSLSDGEVLQPDAIVLCTGVRARELPHIVSVPGVHVLRTLEDAQAIGSLLDENERVVVIGGGFIGAEVAAVARERGLEVCLAEPAPTLMLRGIGPRWGSFMERVHRERGVDVRTGTGVHAVEGNERLQAVVLSDGTRIETSLMVVGIGGVPNTEWLEDSGLEIDNGVVVDAHGETATPGIWAVGDVARFYHDGYGEHVRMEHWTNAVEMAKIVAQNMLQDSRAVFVPTPLVWSDQYDLKLQTAGRFLPDDEEIVTMGSEEEGEFLALRGRGGVLTGALSVNRASMLVRMKMLIAKGASLDDAVAMATKMHRPAVSA